MSTDPPVPASHSPDRAASTTTPAAPVPVWRRHHPALLIAALAGALLVVVATVVAVTDRTPGELGLADAVVLGVVEGVTEYLPVSSTGHLTVTQRLLDIVVDDETEDAADSYAISIQLGAILAVLLLFWGRVTSVVRGVAGTDPQGRRLAISLVIAFAPAASVGLVLGDAIKDNLFSIGTVVVAWAVGGVAILVLGPRLTGGARPLEALDPGRAAVIGACQVLALWPGMSRSLVTILAALAVGMTMRAAVEFSFLLGLGTLGAATIYETVREGDAIVEQFGLAAPLVGAVTALVAAVVSVRWLIEYLNGHSLAIFGWYRLGIAAVVAALALSPAL